MVIAREPLADLGADGAVRPGARGLWPYTQHRRWLVRCRAPMRVDPMNLMVVGAAPDDVLATLASAGWARPDDGAVHRTWFDGRFVRMRDHTALGTRQERIHVRLFAIAGHTLAAAHHEVADERGHHIVTSWDRARAGVCEALVAGGWRLLEPSAPVASVDVRGVDGDGRLWRLTR